MELTSPQEKANIEEKLQQMETRLTKIEDIVFHIDYRNLPSIKQQQDPPKEETLEYENF